MKPDRKRLDAAANGREWHIVKHVPHMYELECCVCPRYGVCRKHDRCSMTKGMIRNWKEFRRTRWRES